MRSITENRAFYFELPPIADPDEDLYSIHLKLEVLNQFCNILIEYVNNPGVKERIYRDSGSKLFS